MNVIFVNVFVKLLKVILVYKKFSSMYSAPVLWADLHAYFKELLS